MAFGFINKLKHLINEPKLDSNGFLIYSPISGEVIPITDVPDVDFSETNELGKVKKVDHLGITDLRIRGMWHIENPFVTFSYIYKRNEDKNFTLMAIINEEKIESFNNFTELVELSQQIAALHIEDKEIKDPNNPANLHKVKLITFTV